MPSLILQALWLPGRNPKHLTCMLGHLQTQVRPVVRTANFQGSLRPFFLNDSRGVNVNCLTVAVS